MLLLLLSHFSCVQLCNPIDGSLQGSPVPRILPAILIPACASSSPVFLMMYSAQRLNKLLLLLLSRFSRV